MSSDDEANVVGSAAEDGSERPKSEAAVAAAPPALTDDVAGEAPSVDGASDPTTDNPMTHPLVQDLILHPSRWRIWPAAAVLRWLHRRLAREYRITFRTRPSLSFAASEVHEIVFGPDGSDLVLNAPGLATAGSALPSSDIARIIADERQSGALATWLDGPSNRFMQLLEEVKVHCDAAYSLMTGGGVEAFGLVAGMVGRSAPLAAGPGGELHDDLDREPQGAVGLAGLFVGPVSAAGLAAAMRAFTGLPARVEEFTGATVPVARPARVGAPLGMMLGIRCRLPSAGVEVHLEGGDRPAAREWARDAVRRRSLRVLASAYVGGASPAVRRFLWLDPANAPPAALDGGTALGGLAVLGRADARVRLPLAG